MTDIRENLQDVRARIACACTRAGRNVDSVELIAVSKTYAVERVSDAYDAGQTVFGESRWQEAEPKVSSLPPSIHWHYIGNLQRNKIRRLLPNFEVIHAVDSLRLASYTNEIAKELGLFPKIFLQVNLAGEAVKGGFDPDRLRNEMAQLLSLERLEILGLMCIPPFEAIAGSARKWFAGLRTLRDELECDFGVRLPSLSMGMSGDFEVAIEEGATHVRVGSAIFGNRAYRVDDKA